MAMSIQLRTGLDYLMQLPLDDLCEIAQGVADYAEAVKRAGGKQ